MTDMDAGNIGRRIAGARAGLAWGLVAAALALLASPALAGEESKPADPNQPPRVYTNKDLARYRSARRSSRIVVSTTTLPGQADADAAAAPGELYPDEKERRLAELRGSIQEAEARIAELEKRARSIANPFLPRPQLSEEERKAQAGMSGKEIQARILAEKADLEAKVAALESELDALVATPTRPRTQLAPQAPQAGIPPPPQPEP